MIEMERLGKAVLDDPESEYIESIQMRCKAMQTITEYRDGLQAEE